MINRSRRTGAPGIFAALFIALFVIAGTLGGCDGDNAMVKKPDGGDKKGGGGKVDDAPAAPGDFRGASFKLDIADKGEAPPFKVIETGTKASAMSVGPHVLWANDAESLKKLYARIFAYEEPAPAPPDVDMDNNFVFMLYLGNKIVGGQALVIEDWSVDEHILKLRVERTFDEELAKADPGPRPYALLSIEKGKITVVDVDSSLRFPKQATPLLRNPFPAPRTPENPDKPAEPETEDGATADVPE